MKKVLVFVVIGAMIFGLVKWKSTLPGNKQVAVTVSEVESSVLHETVLASGHLVFNKHIKIRPEVTGLIHSVLIEEGDLVKAGQLLAQLDQTAFNAEVERTQALVELNKIEISKAKANHGNAVRKYEQQLSLFQRDLIEKDVMEDFKHQTVITEIDINAANYNLKQANAALSTAKDRLSKTLFYAPMDGIVSSLNVKEGETVVAGTTNIIGSDILTVADPSYLLAELRVDEADISAITEGQDVEVFAASNPDLPFTGKIESIGITAKRHRANSGLSFNVKVLLMEKNIPLYPGTSCRAEIFTKTGEDTINVPISAIQTSNGKSWVWVVGDDNSVNKQEVSPGTANDTHQIVTSGLEKGQLVVIGPSRLMGQLQENDSVSFEIDSQ